MVDCYLLSDLQLYLQQYPAAHYSHNGKEPLLYVVVLLLSLQFRCRRWLEVARMFCAGRCQ